GHLMEETYASMSFVFPDARFRVSARTRESAERFARRLGGPDRPPLHAAGSTAEAVDGADIIVSITVADRPMILPGMLKRGATMLSMGGAPEVEFGVLAEIDRLFVDELQ